MNCPKCNKEIDEKSVFCTGCGERLKEGKTLKVTRQKRAMGFAIPFPVYLDGKKLGDLKNGATIECEITEGEHTIELKAVEKTIKQGIVIKKDTKEVEVKTRLQMGLVAGVPKILDIIYK